MSDTALIGPPPPRPLAGGASTLVEALRARAAQEPDKVTLRFLADGREVGASLDYRSLDARARALAARLQQAGAAGERALLLLPNGPDYVVAFFGCLYAGVIAVPAYPPDPLRPQHRERLAAMIGDAEPRWLLTDRANHAAVAALAEGRRGLELLCVAETPPEQGADWRPPRLAGGEVAFLQYTSGSTASPKGVEVTHGNLVDNQAVMAWGFEVKPDDLFVSWLPLYHDMGLIAGLVLPVFLGVPLVMMTPQHFLARPARWLEAIHRYRGTVSGGPDFAYRLCCEQIGERQRAELDLASWRIAFSGAEPVRADTLADFAGRFAPAGFDARSLCPSYGLAEATLAVTITRRRGPPRLLRLDPAALAADRVVPAEQGVDLVGCGTAPRPEMLRIVAPESLRPCGEGEVGEIWVSGGSVARGYWRNPAATAEVFPEREGRRWLRSGDLGFLHRGDLYVTGRRKDMIILRGENRYPQDIETAVEAAVDAVRKGRVAAFAVAYEGREAIGVAAEIGRGVQRATPPEALVEAIDRAVAESQQEPAALIALLEPGSLPKTTSGKLQRAACRERLASGALAAYHLYRRPTASAARDAQLEPPQGESERRLAAIWCEVLALEAVGRGDRFLALGGHSLLALQAVERIRAAFGVELGLPALFAPLTLAELAAAIEAAPLAVDSGELALRAEPREGPLPLSPAQQRLWLAERLAGEAGRAAYNMTGQLRLSGPLSVAALERALAGLLQRHEILRTAYVEAEDGLPQARVAARAALPLPLLDLSQLAPAAAEARLAEAERAEGLRPFELERAPLLRATLVRLSAVEHRLLVSLHHLIGDGWSFGVMLRDLGALYTAAREGRPAALAPLPLQYLDYAIWQRRQLQGGALERERRFWRERLAGVPPVLALPGDFPRPAVASQAGASLRFTLEGPLAERLEALGRAQGATLFMVLLAAFQLLLHRLTGAEDLVVGTDVAGRPRRELESLIGFFVNVLPLRARLSGELAFPALLEQQREAALQAFEHARLPFDQIVEAAGVPRERSRNPLVQVLFVLQSAPRGGFAVEGLSAELRPAPAQSSKFDMALFLDPLGARAADGLAGEWVFATALFTRARIERLAAAWKALLQQLAEAPARPLRAFLLPQIEESAMPSPAPATTAAAAAGGRLAAKLDKLKKLGAAAPAPAPASAAPVRTRPLLADSLFPLVVEPVAADLDPVAWAGSARAAVEALLGRHGALLFRGFALALPSDFEAFAEALQPGLYGAYGDLPKQEGGRNLYRSTPYPEREMILFHNESAHLHRWPRKQWFFCVQPAPVGGATPIVDCRALYRRLPPELAERFARLGLLYQRTFTERFDVGWRDFFKTDSRAEVEARCRAAGTDFAWLDAETLQTRTRCPAVVTHPLTGERSFFNQVQLHHPRCLDPQVRRDLLALVGPERLPRQVFYGDGTPIEDQVMDRIGGLYEACAVRFDWRKGDVVMLDNLLTAHARDPYEGPRRIVVAMGDMMERAELEAAGCRA